MKTKYIFLYCLLFTLQRRDRAKSYYRSRTDGPSLTYIKREACGIGCKPNLQSRRNPSVGHPACSAYTNKKGIRSRTRLPG